MDNKLISEKTKLCKIEEIIDRIDNSYFSDNKLKEVLNIIENLYAENTCLRQENQNLKNELNKLKGEQGTPNIKKNVQVTTDFSSEKERIEAERSNNPSKLGYGYKLDRKTLSKLLENDIPKDILELLKKMEKEKYSSEKEFINAM